MASKRNAPAARRKTHLTFRRFASGVTTVCIMLVFVGGFIARASVAEITWRAFVTWLCINVIEWVLLRTYMAYEVTRGGERGASPSADPSRSS